MENTELIFKNSESTDDARSISTAQAARMLGMSTTMMQKLVDQEELKAWKTPGGHRRIDLSSVHSYQGRLQISNVARSKKVSAPTVKIIVDDPSATPELKSEVMQWEQFFDISFWHSMPEALLSFANQVPDILIVQMSVPLPQQLSTVSALGKFHERAQKPFSVVCLSDNPELSVQADKGISSHIQLLSQPMTRAWLKAFLMGAHAASKAPNSGSAEVH